MVGKQCVWEAMCDVPNEKMRVILKQGGPPRSLLKTNVIALYIICKGARMIVMVDCVITWLHSRSTVSHWNKCQIVFAGGEPERCPS